jgi:hypothetical protein
MLLPMRWRKFLPTLIVKQMQNPRNLFVHPHQGKQLPHDWAATAAARAQAADDAYAQRTKEAWRLPLGRNQPANPSQAAMLPRNDSTSARTDSALRLIAEDSERWELWQDSHGRTVRRRKK